MEHGDTTAPHVNGVDTNHTAGKPAAPSSPPPSMSSAPSTLTPSELRRRLSILQSWLSEFNSAQRTSVVRVLHPYLGPEQYHWLSGRLPPSQDLHWLCSSSHDCNDFLASLPLHLVHKIIKYLDPVSVVRASQVCKHWHSVMESEWIWRRLSFLPPWRLSPTESTEQIERRKSTDSVSADSDSAVSPCSSGGVVWKKVFRERFKLRRCWLRGQCHVRTFELVKVTRMPEQCCRILSKSVWGL